MARSKTRGNRGATYDTQLIQKGQHYSVIPRISHASSSAIIPVSVKVNVPTWRGKKQNTFCAHKNGSMCAGKKRKKQKKTVRTMTYFPRVMLIIKSNWRVKSHL